MLLTDKEAWAAKPWEPQPESGSELHQKHDTGICSLT